MSEAVYSEVSEVKQDYDITLFVGQYWVKDNEVIAFILEHNEYGVIYQTNVNITEEDEIVFDFEAGQELSSISGFREMLKKRQAKVFTPPEHALVILALNAYRHKLNNRKILGSKVLPRNSEEGQDLIDLETYRLKKRIIPPPFKYRTKKGFHWLKAGASGEITVIKLWDPQADNWVLHSGKNDPTASNGFVNGYLSPVQTSFPENDQETYPELITRVMDLLRRKSYFFDEKWISKELNRFKPSRFNDEYKKDPTQFIKQIGDLPDIEDIEPKFPLFDINLARSKTTKSLMIYLCLDHSVVHGFFINDLENGEFIPNKEISFIYSTEE